MIFGYPNSSTEVRNLDWCIRTVEELQQKVDNLMSDKLDEVIDNYFNKVMIDAIYDPVTETITLKKELVVGDGIHTYNAETNTMMIGDS